MSGFQITQHLTALQRRLLSASEQEQLLELHTLSDR